METALVPVAPTIDDLVAVLVICGEREEEERAFPRNVRRGFRKVATPFVWADHLMDRFNRKAFDVVFTDACAAEPGFARFFVVVKWMLIAEVINLVWAVVCGLVLGGLAFWLSSTFVWPLATVVRSLFAMYYGFALWATIRWVRSFYSYRSDMTRISVLQHLALFEWLLRKERGDA